MRSWTGEEFAASRSEWDDLLGRSEADPLFMSWDWQWRWWVHHAPVLGATLRLAAVYAGARLVGLAPFYSRAVTVKGIIPARRLELIGIGWREPQAMFSDYLDIIADRACRDSVAGVLDEWLAGEDYWDEMAICCTPRSGFAARLVGERLARWTYLREVDPLDGWCASLPGTFEDYVRRLHPSVRRKLFNQRHKLAAPHLEYAEEADLDQTLRSLWQLSAERWDAGAPPAHIQAFHRDAARHFARTGELRLTRLMTDEGTRSILYLIQRAGTAYYLQSGFDLEGARGLSLGYLHFGYAIEAAYREGVERFDFLAGRGRHRDYKRDLLTESVPVVSYHVVRGSAKRALYATYEYIRARRNSLRAT